jgi:hypothetical protein
MCGAIPIGASALSHPPSPCCPWLIECLNAVDAGEGQRYTQTPAETMKLRRVFCAWMPSRLLRATCF